jgi:hypothetical protein
VATSRPTLSAVLSDPVKDDQPAEGNQVTGRFEAWWTDASGVQERLAYTTRRLPSGDTQRWQLPEDVPADTVVSWHVRADDGTAVSPWSSDGSGSVCQFVYDDVRQEAPVITSTEYPEDELHDGVGVYGSFTMDSSSPDVVRYRYTFMGKTPQDVRPEQMGGPATIRYLPLSAGPTYLHVAAVDRSGHASQETSYTFRVDSGRAPVAHWKLADAGGSGTAAAESGSSARAGTGVTFGGPTPQGTDLSSTAVLDGSGNAFLTPDAPAVDTHKTFAVSAWVRPAESDRTMTVASQDGGKGPAFTLGLHSDDNGSTWSFAIGDARVAGGAPESGEWAHLIGLYDTEAGKARLYVNGQEVGSRAEATPATVQGAFPIGRAKAANGYQRHWHGTIGDVRVYDRILASEEVADLTYRQPRPAGHWSLEGTTDGTSPEKNGGAPLRLGPGSSIHSCDYHVNPDCIFMPPALAGVGHLLLDGDGGYAALDSPVVDTAHSFSIGVVVRLADKQPAHPMTVLSQAGEHTEAFKVRYDPSQDLWQLFMPVKDEAGAAGNRGLPIRDS